MIVSIAQAAEAVGASAEVPGFFADPETWIAIVWLIVVGLLARPVFRALTGALDKRRDLIRNRLEEAERLRVAAQELLTTYQRKQSEALKDAEAIVTAARQEAERLAAEAARDLDAMVRRREQQALERIAQAETDAIRDVRDTAIDLAIAATRKMLIDTLSADQAAALVDAAIQDLPGRLH